MRKQKAKENRICRKSDVCFQRSDIYRYQRATYTSLKPEVTDDIRNNNSPLLFQTALCGVSLAGNLRQSDESRKVCKQSQKTAFGNEKNADFVL